MLSVLSTVLIVEGDLEQKDRICDNLCRVCLCDRIIHFPAGQDMMDFLCGNHPDQPHWEMSRFAIVIHAASGGIDAHQILVQLKNNPELSRIPVIVLAETPDDAFHFYSEGCSFYVVKPAEYDVLMHCIDAVGGVLSMSQMRLPLVVKHKVQAAMPVTL
jgi:DNA-binding NarL/FixJ family response regulator